MIQSFRIVNNIGESITLDIRKPEVSGFLVSSVQGLTYPKADISANEIAMFDGATVTNRRIGARNIVMGIIFYDSNNDKNTIEELRHKCYRYFPIKQEVTFYVTNDSGTYWIKGYVEANEINIFSKAEAAQISIICPDPYFVKDKSGGIDYVSSIIPIFHFPFSSEIEIIDLPGYSNYTGSWIVVPKKIDQQILTSKKYFYGNLTITKVLAKRNVNDKGGYTAEIYGSPKADKTQTIGKENSSTIFTKYTGATSFNPGYKDQIINLNTLYLNSNLTVKKIPYTTSTEESGTTVNIGSMGSVNFNPFSYTDYTGKYYIVPKKTDQTIQVSNKYMLKNIVVTKYLSKQEANDAGGYTFTVFGDTNYIETTPALLNTDVYSEYNGPYEVASQTKAVTIKTSSKYSKKNIIVSAIPNVQIENEINGNKTYTVSIGLVTPAGG